MKIAVVGTTGSGKSTLATHLSRQLNLPWIELDSFYHLPNWQEESQEVFAEKITSAMAHALEVHDGWIVDGNYGSKLGDLVIRDADVVLYFNLAKRIVMFRIVKRSLQRVLFKEVLWNGNRERVRNLFKSKPEENVVMWAYTTHSSRKTQLLSRAKAAPSHQLWIEITRGTKLDELIEQLNRRKALSQY